MINTTPSSPSLFSSLDDLLNWQHPLHKLSHKINWSLFEEAFISLYCPDNGRPAKPICLMCGLLILKHLRNLSDESVVEQWGENAYFQYFCGMDEFVPSFPCNSSQLVHFRKRITARCKFPHTPRCTSFIHLGVQDLYMRVYKLCTSGWRRKLFTCKINRISVLVKRLIYTR